MIDENKTSAAENQLEKDGKNDFYPSSAPPESESETIRKSGLAYSAGLALGGSVIFLLIVGWILDSFFGTAPWCLLGGIVVGSALGFYQFFRITSKIFKKDV